MMLTRRDFVVGVGAGAVGTAFSLRAFAQQSAAISNAPARDVRALIERGLEAARAAGAAWADVRVERIRSQRLRSRDDHLVGASDEESYGVGVRAIVDGVWGFAATYRAEPEAVVKAAQQAVGVARANRRIAGRKVALAPANKAVGKWRSPMEVDPFTVPLTDKVEALLGGARAALAVPGAPQVKVNGQLVFVRQDKIIGNSEGSYFEQTFVRGQPQLQISIIDAQHGQFEEGSTDGFLPPAQIGFETFAKGRFIDAARRTAEATVRRLGAAPVEPGKYDLVIAPSNLWLTIHESVGHPTELDRALGYEANYAGTSFATPDQLGKLRYGSEIVNVVADRRQKGALASCAWDDDGDAADQWDLIHKGILVGFQTTREQASWIDQHHGHATNYAQSWRDVPFQRMPNVSLQPGTKRLTPAELIADTKRGIYVEGRGSWSIDQQRYNFQFGGQAFTLIEEGKLTRPLRYVAYQSNSCDFWRACDAICDRRDYRLSGSLSDGKGEPGQVNPVSHGCSTARFRQINVINVRA
jgi:TldD protein